MPMPRACPLLRRTDIIASSVRSAFDPEVLLKLLGIDGVYFCATLTGSLTAAYFSNSTL
jgi:hypothetical protein